MLVNLPGDFRIRTDWQSEETHALDDIEDIQHIGKGMYLSAPGMPFLVESLLDNSYEGSYPYEIPHDLWEQDDNIVQFKLWWDRHLAENWPSSYGSCDYPYQLIEKHPIILSDTRPLVVFFSLLTRNQEGRNGWRWHKSGPYIGEGEPRCEYLDDEPEISYVFTYDIQIASIYEKSPDD